MITLLVIVVGNIWGYARLTFQTLAHGRRLEKIEADFDKHAESPALHRNPDFERQLEEIRRKIVQMDAKLDRLIERRS